MIRLGLTSFSEHDYLTGKKRATLYEYASHLPLVEMDTAYYGIPPKERVAEWVKAVPENFRFVMKVYSGISCQGEWQTYYASEEEMITAFLESMAPLIESKNYLPFWYNFQEHLVVRKKMSLTCKKFVTGLKTYPSPLNYEIIHGINQTL